MLTLSPSVYNCTVFQIIGIFIVSVYSNQRSLQTLYQFNQINRTQKIQQHPTSKWTENSHGDNYMNENILATLYIQLNITQLHDIRLFDQQN